MSYSFDPHRSYRMPTHFGPNPGPRQRPEGGFYDADEGQRSVAVWATFEADSEQIAALLPEGFAPSAQPDLTIEIKNMTNIGWLAGRGYSVVFVTTGVTYGGEEGRFKLVLWENAADPIITGREELGYPKVYAEIPEIRFHGDSASASASWDGFTFLELDVSDVHPDASAVAPGGPSYHLKYIPRAGAVGTADLSQVIVTPPGQGPLAVVSREGGRGSARVNSATWEQLPTLVNIVNGLAALRLGECRAAGVLRTAGTTDLRDQRVVAGVH